jgi:hypothetical protein
MKVPNFLYRNRSQGDSSQEDLVSESPLEASIPLEESVPLESAREVISLPIEQKHQAARSGDIHPIEAPKPTASVLDKAAPVVEQATVPLLEERLVVKHQRRKVGEVIVRKEIEVQIIQVPVRREKLIVEQITPDRQQLASIVLLEENYTDSTSVAPQPTIRGEFPSAQEASQFLQAIANQPHLNSQKVQLSLVLADPNLLEVYQQWLQNYAANGRSQSPTTVRIEESRI